MFSGFAFYSDDASSNTAEVSLQSKYYQLFFGGGGEVRKELLVLSDGDHYLSSIYHIVVQSSNPAHLLNLLKDIASL